MRQIDCNLIFFSRIRTNFNENELSASEMFVCLFVWSVSVVFCILVWLLMWHGVCCTKDNLSD